MYQHTGAAQTYMDNDSNMVRLSTYQISRHVAKRPSKYIVSKFNIEKKKINLTIHFQSSKTSHCKLFNRLQKCGLLLVFNSLALKIKQFIIQHSTTQQKGQYCTYQTSEFLLNNNHFPYLFPYAYYSIICLCCQQVLNSHL